MGHDIILEHDINRSPRQPEYVRKPFAIEDAQVDIPEPVVFLDLDNTIISALTTDEVGPATMNALKRRYPHHINIDRYVVFPRRHIDEFLTDLFASYRVGVWTHASKGYAEVIIKEFILRPDRSRELEIFLWYDHTEYLRKGAPNTLKPLDALGPVFNLKNMDDAYIIDDNSMVKSTNPDRCTAIKAFNATDNDAGGDSLLRCLSVFDSTVRYGEPLPNIPYPI